MPSPDFAHLILGSTQSTKSFSASKEHVIHCELSVVDVVSRMDWVASATRAPMGHEVVELVLDGLSGDSLVLLQVLQEDAEALACVRLT